jgi:uncharacterized protein with FMN-binding domain
MKRITYWLLSTVSVVVLLFGFDASNHATSVSSPPAVLSGAGGGVATGGSSTSSGTESGSSSSGSSGSKTVTGGVASTQWGPVQVRLSISGGKITGVTVLQQPNGNPKDEEINSNALPILNKETLQNQSAHIDMVSGATVTSTGYLQSLQSAIDQAGL